MLNVSFIRSGQSYEIRNEEKIENTIEESKPGQELSKLILVGIVRFLHLKTVESKSNENIPNCHRLFSTRPLSV